MTRASGRAIGFPLTPCRRGRAAFHACGFLRDKFRRAHLALAVLALAGFGAWSSSAWAQSTSASLVGVVRGPSGEAIPAARVQARSDASGASRTTETDAQGRWRLDGLAPGSWTVVARGAEGQLSETRTVVLRLQQTLNLPLTLGAGLTETVEVGGQAPLVDPKRTGGQLRVEGAQADALPLLGRTVTDLALLDASVRPTPPGNFYGERGSVFVLNGQSGRSNSFLVDGLDNNDLTSGTTLNSSFSQQVISQFVVQTHGYAAEFGRASGGVLNIITQRGSNDTTGELFLQQGSRHWNDPGSLAASLPHQAGDEDVSERWSGGFRVGGPLKRDRAFYFAAYEHQSADEVIPYTGVTRDGVAGGLTVAPSHDDNIFVRTDFNLTPNQMLLVRVSADDRSTSQVNVGGTMTPEAGFHLDESDGQVAAALTSVISANLLNEARLLIGNSDFNQKANSDRPGVERPSGVFGGNNLNRQDRNEKQIQLVENLTWSHGPHTMKFGTDVAHSRTEIATAFNPSGNFIYDSDQKYEPGDCGDLYVSLIEQVKGQDPSFDPHTTPIPCPGVPGVDDDGDGTIDEPGYIGSYPVVYQYIFGRPKAQLNDTRVALFAQDTWQATGRLQLDYGLRYDLSTYTLPDGTRVESTVPNGGAGRDWNNIAPRAGFTYTPGEAGRTVLRGGAGIFYDKIVLGFPGVAAITSGTAIGLTFPQGLTAEVTEDFVEQYGAKFLIKNGGLFFLDNLILRFSTGTDLDTPYSVQYSGEIERALGPRSSARASFTRALGYHTVLLRDLNPPDGTDPQGFPSHPADPSTGSIAAFVTEGRTWYSGLDLGWAFRAPAGWMTLSYTLSRAEDLGPDPLKGGIALPPDSNDIAGERARSDADRRHRFVAAGDAPILGTGFRISGLLQAATGAPINVTTGGDENLDGITSDRPEGVRRNTGKDTPMGPVNALRRDADLPDASPLTEPDFLQVDVRVSYPFGGPTSDRMKRFQGEGFLQVFNVFDRFNGGLVEGRALSRDFGRAVGEVGPPRTLELGLKLGF